MQIKLNNQTIENFLQEIIMMRQFSHPNVMSLMEISVQNSKPCALLPLMSHGDIESFLQRNGKVSKFLLNYLRNIKK